MPYAWRTKQRMDRCLMTVAFVWTVAAAQGRQTQEPNQGDLLIHKHHHPPSLFAGSPSENTSIELGLTRFLVFVGVFFLAVGLVLLYLNCDYEECGDFCSAMYYASLRNGILLASLCLRPAGNRRRPDRRPRRNIRVSMVASDRPPDYPTVVGGGELDRFPQVHSPSGGKPESPPPQYEDSLPRF